MRVRLKMCAIVNHRIYDGWRMTEASSVFVFDKPPKMRLLSALGFEEGKHSPRESVTHVTSHGFGPKAAKGHRRCPAEIAVGPIPSRCFETPRLRLVLGNDGRIGFSAAPVFTDRRG